MEGLRSASSLAGQFLAASHPTRAETTLDRGVLEIPLATANIPQFAIHVRFIMSVNQHFLG
jgi:hypothetical protein